MDTKTQCYLNGEIVPLAMAKISVLDRGFLFGDGVYEVVPIYDGRLFCWARHLRRLTMSLSSIGMCSLLAGGGDVGVAEGKDGVGGDVRVSHVREDVNKDASGSVREDVREGAGVDGYFADYLSTYSKHANLSEHLQAVAQQLIRHHATGDGMIYLQISRGVAASRGHAFPNPAPLPTIFMMSVARSPMPADKKMHGVACKTVRDIRWLRGEIKSVSLLAAVLFSQDAAANGMEEVIGIRDGCVSEAAACNVLLVCDGVLHTPAADHRILGGISREVVLQLACELGIPIDEGDIAESVLHTADELMLTSSSREIMPITMLDGRRVGDGTVGPIYQKLQAAFNDFVAQKRE